MKSYLIQFRLSFVIIFLLLTQLPKAQDRVLIHSHNDYKQTVPFYQAYAQMLDSYEADVFYDNVNKIIYVAHTPAEIRSGNTLEALYLQPIVSQFKRNGGKAWAHSDKSFYLMIDIKHDYQHAIPAVLLALDQCPEVFNPYQNPNAPILVFTGDIPTPEQFDQYPDHVCFDGSPGYDYSSDQLKRIAFFSDSFRHYSVWNGKGSILPAEKQKLRSAIAKAHDMGKKIRFWGSPDNLNTWQTFRMMGVDIINTDHPEKCADFFSNEQKHNFAFGSNDSVVSDSLIRPDKLDKTTRSFYGFDPRSLSLDSPINVYQPSGRNDGENMAPKNIILLIGDGMGLTQISAADLVNRGLSFTQLKFIGLQRTQPERDFITDSAGAGSGLATGKKTPNRAIATDGGGNIHPSLTEIFLVNDKTCGIVTNGSVADATPAAFYGHSDERDNTDEITAWLMKTQLDFIAGSGRNEFVNRKDGRNLLQEMASVYQVLNSIDEPCKENQKVILLDEQLAEGATRENLNLLAQTTEKAISHLSKSDNGFFLMVEGAKIDYAGHANSFPSSIVETLGFDLAVQEALRFADRNGETLVIITGDHETGGLSIIDGNVEEGRISGVYSSDDHTPVFLPVFAYGPGAASFIGVYENTDVFSKLLNLYGW